MDTDQVAGIGRNTIACPVLSDTAGTKDRIMVGTDQCTSNLETGTDCPASSADNVHVTVITDQWDSLTDKMSSLAVRSKGLDLHSRLACIMTSLPLTDQSEGDDDPMDTGQGGIAANPFIVKDRLRKTSSKLPDKRESTGQVRDEAWVFWEQRDKLSSDGVVGDKLVETPVQILTKTL